MRKPGVANVLLAVALVLPAVAAAQYFGRNKVVWEPLRFEILETEHFEIHHYPPGAPAAAYAARSAERWYERLSAFFEHEFEEQKPLIIYQDHADFQQTLTTPGLIGEGTGGFTESIQDRVVLPLTGINADNDHVIGHELVHAFQFDIAERTDTERQRRSQPRQLPLWAIEGLAEYLSQGRSDPQTALWMRDAALHDLLPEPGNLIQRRPSPYQYGQAFWAYVGGRFADEAVRRLFIRAMRTGVNEAFENVLGVEEPDRFFDEFHSALRAAYQPLVDRRQHPHEIADPLLTAQTTGASTNMAPSLSPDGSRIAFLSTREFGMDLFLADARTGEISRKLIGAETNQHFDNLSFLGASVAWSPDGSRFAFGVFSEGERRIAIYDFEAGSVERLIDLPGIKGMRHPTWSPDATELAFSAVVDGASDLYRFDLETNELERLTDDGYTAIQPAFSPSGDELVFVTDRGPGTDLESLQFGALKLAALDLQTGDIETLPIFQRGKHIDPHYSPDGESVYFVAAPDGVPDVFRHDLGEGRTVRITALKTGATGITQTSPAISVAAETGTLAFSVLQDGGSNVYRMEPPNEARPASSDSSSTAGTLPPFDSAHVPGLVEGYLSDPQTGLPPAYRIYPRRDYESRIELANLGPATIGVGTTNSGTAAGSRFGAYFADILNRHQIATSIQGGSSQGVLDFGDTIGGDAVYLNQTRRFQWGAQLSRQPFLSSAALVTQEDIARDDGSVVPADVVERLFQLVTVSELSLLGQYPFSINDRLEMTAGASSIDFEAQIDRLVLPAGGASFREQLDLPTPASVDLRRVAAAYVRDTSRFGFVSPVSGTRFRAEAQFTRGDLQYRTNLLDFRRYFLKRPVTLALRALHVGRRGDDADDPRLPPLDIARSSYVRGYSFDSFDLTECTRTPGSAQCPELDRLVGTRIGVFNFEVRVPLLGNEDYGLFNVPIAPTELLFFVDAGAAWSSEESVELRFERATEDRVPVVSAGIGARVLLLRAFPLEFYYAYPYQRPNADPEFGFRISAGW